MRLLWHSNAAHSQTGYGQQTALVTALLEDAGHDVAISAFWGVNGRKLDWSGMTVYPGGPDFGDTWLPGYAMDWFDGDPNAGWIVTLMDVWSMKDKPELLNAFNLACWCPVDHDPMSLIVREWFRRVPGAVPIAMSRFGVEKFAEKDMEALYAPHGIDTEVFKPYPQADMRKGLGLPADAFVIGMVANNQGNAPPRKAFPQVFEAFAEFQKTHDDAFLYCHSNPDNIRNGLNLHALAQAVGVKDGTLAFTPPLAMQLGIEQSRMAQMYSAFDVLASPSYGEGFGIPIVEAQACGVPVIVNSFTAMPELVGDGWITEGERLWDMSQGSWFKHATVSSILDCFEQAYEQRGGGSEKAREFAVGYDARTVFETYWLPILDELEKRRKEKTKMPEVTLNRAGRRKSRKKVA